MPQSSRRGPLPMSLKQVLLSRICRSFTTLFRKFMVTPLIHIPFVIETSNVYRVTDWAKVIDIAAARTCVLLQIDHRKSKGPKGHEFLYIELLHCSSGTTRHLVAERMVEIPAGSPSSASSSSSSLINKVTLLTASSSPPNPACDRIHFFKDPCGR